ncbi:hypothetical protein Dsin_012718 [Dipteronia sinensis]|uniref:Protein ENDOSPERM DEFECTIVE 1 n=1 Tax=Dipteronia sinensis TaxID=43782 RepID=A0AAE0AJ22_9ROSI|nr:hypothetical protein Dsin_012718 [Dipteronia sinensis]
MNPLDHTTSDTNSTPAMAAPPPPPPPHRRPRVREVSSRFMSPMALPTSSSCGDPHLVSAKSPLIKQRQRRHQDGKETDQLMSSSGVTDENHRPIDTARSLESPFQFQRRPVLHHHQQQQQPPRSVMKLFNENGGKFTGRSSRPDTPTLTTSTTTTLSKSNRLIQRSTSNNNTATATAATKLLQSLSSQEDTNSINSDDNSSQCSPETDMLPIISARLLCERNSNNNINRVNVNAASTPFWRSLNLSTSALSRSFSNSSKMGGVSLPPVPPASVKPGADAAKKGGRKASNQQEDMHALKMLHNRYLQWRFANAKEEASRQAQTRETERMLYSLGLKISDLYDSVKRKRVELGLLQRTETLSAILEAQMPYLDEWSAFEGDYSVSLSEIIQALLNTSLQLPIGGNIKVDVREVGEALSSAAKLMEILISNIQSFVPKADEMEILISELAKVTGGEKALIEECGDLLYKTHAFQVEECSLRGQIMQFNQKLRAPSKSRKMSTVYH